MKLVVSVMPKSLEEAQEIDVSRYEDADIIEWRADFLAKDDILNVAPAIFEKFAGRELIFTLRTRQEGGEIELSDDEYVALIKEVAGFTSRIISILNISLTRRNLKKCLIFLIWC